VSWSEFQVNWSRIVQAAGVDLATVMELAENDDYSLGTGNLNHDRVARLMRSAAIVRGDGDYFMDYRTMGRCLGLSPVAARKVALQLVQRGVLMVAQNGTVGIRGKATVWRWLGPPGPDVSSIGRTSQRGAPSAMFIRDVVKRKWNKRVRVER
jgi:hypothetical protein